MGKKKEQPLRFAALIRVSTERQEKQGESLRTQRKQITDAVTSLGGIITEWYGGQEHATNNFEHAEVDRLLDDAAEEPRPFDCIVVTHPDRWSRDNVASQTGLDRLKVCGVRFFTLSTEHDLFDPNAEMYLAMSAVIGKYQAKTQKKKSLDNRIERAKRGVPSSGQLPFGRTYDRETGTWGVDKRKKDLIRDAAKRYLSGESIASIAAEYNLDGTNLLFVLKERCGEIWEQYFDKREWNQGEVVIATKVPRLLAEKTIKAIHQRTEANSTYLRRTRTTESSLARFIFCSHCGSALIPQMNNSGTFRYYRHLDERRTVKKHTEPCPRPRKLPHGQNNVPADLIEQSVVMQLHSMFGNPAAMRKAIEDSIPYYEQIKQDREREQRLEEQLTKIGHKRDKIIRRELNESLTKAQADKFLDELKDEEHGVKAKLEQLRLAKDVLSPEQIEKASVKLSGFYQRGADRIIAEYKNQVPFMDYEEQRELAETVFAGKTADGRRLGVYVTWTGDEIEPWRYEITGHLVHLQDLSPYAEPEPRKGYPPKQRALLARARTTKTSPSGTAKSSGKRKQRTGRTAPPSNLRTVTRMPKQRRRRSPLRQSVRPSRHRCSAGPTRHGSCRCPGSTLPPERATCAPRRCRVFARRREVVPTRTAHSSRSPRDHAYSDHADARHSWDDPERPARSHTTTLPPEAPRRGNDSRSSIRSPQARRSESSATPFQSQSDAANRRRVLSGVRAWLVRK